MRVLLCAVLVLAGCEPRQPLTRGEAVGIAGSLQRIEGQAWGDPVEVLPPPEHADPDGRRWWQIRYAPAADGAARIVLVDDATGWARFPPPGWPLRLAAPAAAPRVPDLRADPGPWLLVVVPPAEPEGEVIARLESEAVRLNTRAGADGRLPLFSVRRDGARAALVYGWTGSGGIARDERLRGWVAAAAGRDPAWLDLGSP
ncbi:MAG: hypothetical protein RLZZ127_2053 [Planctomycetota bacterium]|jgi:hypothetical protein